MRFDHRWDYDNKVKTNLATLFVVSLGKALSRLSGWQILKWNNAKKNE